MQVIDWFQIATMFFTVCGVIQVSKWLADFVCWLQRKF